MRILEYERTLRNTAMRIIRHERDEIPRYSLNAESAATPAMHLAWKNCEAATLD